MIIVIANREYVDYLDNYRVIVSHGIDLNDNDRLVVLPQVYPEEIGAKFDPYIGEYVIYDEDVGPARSR